MRIFCDLNKYVLIPYSQPYFRKRLAQCVVGIETFCAAKSKHVSCVCPEAVARVFASWGTDINQYCREALRIDRCHNVQTHSIGLLYSFKEPNSPTTTLQRITWRKIHIHSQRGDSIKPGRLSPRRQLTAQNGANSGPTSTACANPTHRGSLLVRILRFNRINAHTFPLSLSLQIRPLHHTGYTKTSWACHKSHGGRSSRRCVRNTVRRTRERTFAASTSRCCGFRATWQWTYVTVCCKAVSSRKNRKEHAWIQHRMRMAVIAWDCPARVLSSALDLFIEPFIRLISTWCCCFFLLLFLAKRNAERLEQVFHDYVLMFRCTYSICYGCYGSAQHTLVGGKCVHNPEWRACHSRRVRCRSFVWENHTN